VREELLEPMPNATLDQIAMNVGPGLRTQSIGKGLSNSAAAATSPAPYGVARGIEPAAGGWATGPVRSGTGISAELAVVGAARAGIGAGLLAQFSTSFRFPVLVSWEFTCTADGGFERLMSDLRVGLLGTIDAAQPAPIPEVAPTGHVALDHRSRRGDNARSWYRGPLVPQPTERLQPDSTGALVLAQVADQLRRVVPDGREDVSLAALFEIGRLLTLSKPTMVAALIQWRRELFGAARARELADLLSGTVLAEVGLAVAGGRDRLEDLVRNSLVGAFTRAPAGKLAPDAQERTAARVPDALRGLDPAGILAGLGTSSAMVARVVKQSGVDGLAAVPVPVVAAATAPVSRDDQALLGLADHLAARVDALTASALKSDVVAPKGAKRAKPPPDTLDRLIRDAAARRKG
jgi:hypothetical protein